MASISDRVIAFVGQFPGRDDDEISRALQVFPRQTVNQACRALAARGLLVRRIGPRGKISNFPSSQDVRTVASASMRVAREPSNDPQDSGNYLSAWYWEGNVSETIAEWLGKEGCTIISVADTRSRERGIDVRAEKSGVSILVEVKGFPSRNYRDERKAGQIKPTNPTVQARHWFAHAILKAMRLQYAEPSARVFLGFPDFPVYRQLAKETEGALAKIGIGLWFVTEAGDVIPPRI